MGQKTHETMSDVRCARFRDGKSSYCSPGCEEDFEILALAHPTTHIAHRSSHIPHRTSFFTHRINKSFKFLT